MPVLHIEHQIADLGTWLRDFASRAPAREKAGVTEVHVLQAQDDPQHIVELLFFDTTDAANNYRTFLRKQVWSSSSPGLAGNPSAIILEELETAEDLAAAVLRSTAAAERSARGVKERKEADRCPARQGHRAGPVAHRIPIRIHLRTME